MVPLPMPRTTAGLLVLLSLALRVTPLTLVTSAAPAPARDFLAESSRLLDSFYDRYNATREVDLVLVLDRSGSVPRDGWASMLHFVEKLLEHFTIDRDNTRVAVVTYSTTARVDINDLDPLRLDSNLENKCTLFTRMRDLVEPRMPSGYTATAEALNKTYSILLNSRPNAKKAVLVLTDGKSNIGPPPVKVAVDILALRWSAGWDEDALGPQVEIYAFGIENAYVRELKSMASKLPHHVWLIPSFSWFADLARSLHGGLQEDNWVPTGAHDCGATCRSQFAMCMCGSKIGVSKCACRPGMYIEAGNCTECPIGFYKDNHRPETCRPCPENMTTRALGAVSELDCFFMPGHRRCPALPEVAQADKFRVTGARRDEVLNTGVNCDGVRDGDSCHYECHSGYRLSGAPVMVCNSSGLWEGQVPACSVVDCQRVETVLGGPLEGGGLLYLQNHTTYGAVVNITCHASRVAMPTVTSVSCDQHGHWTLPQNFRCQEVYCPPLAPAPYMSADPSLCTNTSPPHGSACQLTCAPGFRLDGSGSRTCGYTDRALWQPETAPACTDVEKPDITCPDNVTVTASQFGDQEAQVHVDWRPTVLQDNSGHVNFSIKNFPANSLFPLGHTPLIYEAIDGAGITRTCLHYVHVLEKLVEILDCTQNITLTGGAQIVTWPDPVFRSPDGTTLSHTCTRDNSVVLSGPDNIVTCYHEGNPSVTCTFYVIILALPCPEPSDYVPANGLLECWEGREGRACQVLCQVSHTMDGLKEQQYKCQADGTWNKPLTDIKTCYRTRWGEKLTIGETLQVRYQGRCQDNKEAIKAGFHEAMTVRLSAEYGTCEPPHTCEVTNVKIFCGTTSGRKRRASETISRDGNRLWKRSTDQAPNMEIQFILSVSREEDTFNSSHPEMTLEDQRNLVRSFGRVADNFTFTVWDGNFRFMASGEEVLGLTDVAETELPEIALNCSEDQVTVIQNDDIQTLLASCITCAPGTYQSGTEGKCVSCREGTYQEQEGQDHCDVCPSGTWTTRQGAWSSSQCVAQCPASYGSETGYEPCSALCPRGSHSVRGWEPCTLCPLGQYQDRRGRTSCVECPMGTTTTETGATGLQQCGVLCPNNTYSRSGLEPCEVCPAGTYQPLEGQTGACGVCDYHSPTPEIQLWCPDPVNCTSYNVDCVHGFCVLSHVNKTQCACEAGYHGDACELDVDECVSDLCNHDGLCLNGVNGYSCNCTEAFSGPNCETYVGACSTQPCRNGGSCLDRNLTYECLCPVGYSGSRCEQEVDPCATDRCAHGSCAAQQHHVSCVCQEGFAGVRCEKAIDFCSNITCLHGDACFVNGTEAKCACALGYAGLQCEKRVDYCTPDPCNDNGRCVNALQTYRCVCENGFHGTDCDRSVAVNFDLVFEDQGSQHVEVSIWEDLQEVTSCLWARTRDPATNGGTLFSYSAVSNWLNTDFADVFTLYDLGSLKIIINGELASTKVHLPPRAWHHVCVVWSGASGGTTLYVNGSRRWSGELATHTDLQGGGLFTIGQRQVGRFQKYFIPSEGFVGEISRLGVYDAVLDDLDIAELANQSVCSGGDGNIVSWTSTLDGLVHGVQRVDKSLCLDVNECLNNNTCADREVCVDLSGSYQCRKCDTDCEDIASPDGCSSLPCVNGGKCTPVFSGFSCQCPLGYSGMTCELFAGNCSSVKCHNNGRCQEMSGGAQCRCLSPWRGRFCDVRYQPSCDENPCLHNGTCVPMDDASYTCVCPNDGRQFGDNCEVLTACDLDPGPCLDGATCVAFDNGNFTCLCPGDVADSDSNCLYVSSTTAATSTLPVDYCTNVHCAHGGTCQQEHGSFSCRCHSDYTGIYCNELKPKETRQYRVTVSLNRRYDPGLRENEAFKEQFRHEVHKVYAKRIGEDKLEVQIDDIRPGSVELDFTLYHTLYLDGLSPGPGAMENVLYSELEHNRLGQYSASLHNFKFNHVQGSDFMAWGIYLVVVVAMTTVIIAIAVGVYFVMRRRQPSGPKKLNNMPLIELSRVENPAFESDSSPPTPRMQRLPDDNIYSDLNEPSPYAIDLCSDGKGNSDPNLVKNFPSKRNKEVNKDWESIHRQSIPLPPKPGEVPLSNGREDGGYLQPCRGNPPPSYKDVRHRMATSKYGPNLDSDYIAPMSAHDERYGTDEDLYLKPIEEEKDNRSRAQVYENAVEDRKLTEKEPATYLPLFSTSPEEHDTPDGEVTSDFMEQASRSDSPDYPLLRDDGTNVTGPQVLKAHPQDSQPPKPVIRNLKPDIEPRILATTAKTESEEAPDYPPPPVPPESPPVVVAPPLPLQSLDPTPGMASVTRAIVTGAGDTGAGDKLGKEYNLSFGGSVVCVELDKDIPAPVENKTAIYAIRAENS